MRNAMKLNRTMALVGMMGAGKTSIGRRLAARLGVPFRDADHEIEAAAGLTVAEIFERFGEAYFRDGERKVIARLLEEPPHVLATGGGAFMDEATRAAMKRAAFTIWLKAPVGLLLSRVKKRDTRPLLKDGDMRATIGTVARGARTGLCQGRYDVGKRGRTAWRGCRTHHRRR